MSSTGSSRKELNYCIIDPDLMSSRDLVTLSLRQLSSSLPQTTSSRAILSIYLRWLEAHRQQPSKLTEHWQNTLLHWTQSLRSRGFLESEIIRTVEDWKEANGPFRSKDKRHPPTPRDIGMAFDEMKKKYRGDERVRKESLADRLDRPLGISRRSKGTSIRSGDSPPRSKHDSDKAKKKKHKAENFEGKPPGNYICNRCGHKGHHLQVCPSNMDPTYDRPPPENYECEICKARGKHFKSLCPKNTDPYSIIQKRKRQGINTPYSNKGGVFRENEKDVDHQKAVEQRFDRWREPTDGRLSKASSSVSIASSSPNPSLENEKQEKLEKSVDFNSGLAKGKSVGSVDIDELMAESRFDGGGDNNRKRSRMHDQSNPSSRDASPALSVGVPMRKKVRMSDGKEIATSPREESDFAEDLFFTPHSNIDSPRDTRSGSADIFKTDDCSLKETQGSDKKRRQEGETEGAAREKCVRTETFECDDTKNGPYAGVTDDDPFHMHRISIRGPPKFDPKQEEQAEEGAARMNRVGKAPPPEERQVNEKGCDLYNNGNYCSRLDTGLGCPYFHDPEARKVALEERQNRRHCAEHKINPDAMSIDESDTDTSEEIDVEMTPKQYSDFVQMLMHSRPEMSEMVNVVKKRPTALDMWKIDDQRRMEQAADNMPDLAEPSPRCSPFRFEEDSTPTSNTTEPSGAHVRVFRFEYSQLDGAGDEKPADNNKVGQPKSSGSEGKDSPRKNSSSENRPSIHRRISNMGKEAIEKVKELTNYVAEDLQALKSKASSPFRNPSQRADELSPTKLRRRIAADTKIREESNLGDSLNSLKVNAAKSALSLTEERVKGLAQSNSTTVSHASENSFGSLEVNLPGDRPLKPRKPPTSNPFAQYAGRQSIETMQNCNATQIETMLQDSAMAKREASTTSDATDLQSNKDQTNLARKCLALPECKKSDGSGLSDITNVGKT